MWPISTYDGRDRVLFFSKQTAVSSMQLEVSLRIAILEVCCGSAVILGGTLALFTIGINSMELTVVR